MCSKIPLLPNIVIAFLVLWSSLHFCAFVGEAQRPRDREELAAELAEVQEKLEREQTRYRRLTERQKGIEKAVNRASREYDLAVEERKELAELVKQLDEQTRSVNSGIGETKEKMVQERQALRQRIVGVYKLYRRTTAVDYLFQAQSATDLLRRAHYLTAIAAHDHDFLRRLALYAEELEQKGAMLKLLGKQKGQRLRQAKQLEKKLERTKLEKAELLREAREKTASLEKTMALLKRSASELERLLSGIMGGEESIEMVPEPTETPDVKVPRATPAEFQGRGLKSLRGKLSFPVEGKVIQPFGKAKHGEFADVLFVKGLEVSSEVGEKVKAVAAGRVVFSQVLPGYGNVLILDHGKRYYTLYGRLAGTMARVGEVVDAKQVLAVLGQQDQRGRNFYFELRVKGKAIDPVGFFEKRPKFVKS